MKTADPEICFSIECLRNGFMDPEGAVLYVAYIEIRTACVKETGSASSTSLPEPEKSTDELLREMLASIDLLTSHTRQEVERINELEESEDPEDRAEAERRRDELGELIIEGTEPMTEEE
jgi:hypothetical protein